MIQDMIFLHQIVCVFIKVNTRISDVFLVHTIIIIVTRNTIH